MVNASNDAKDIEKLYVYGERLSEAKDKSQNVEDYKSIIQAARSSSVKARQLAAQLIPRFFKFFPALFGSAVDAHLDLCEAEELGIRVQAIRGLPLFCKNTPEHISKIVDILAQLLVAEENVERDAVHKALLSLLRQDVKSSLTALCKHIESTDDDNLRERSSIFIWEKSLQDVTGAEFKMFMDFLKSLSIFGEKAPTKRVQELVEIIEGQADLDAQFIVSSRYGDHVDRLISCLYIALPFFIRGASSSKFLNYLNKHIIPVFDKLPEERKVDLLKNLAESSPYAAPQDSRQILPSVVQLLKKYMPRRKTKEMNFTYVECMLYTFHHLAKAPNATNSLCGYKIVTGQPSDRLGEDFTEFYTDFKERLSCVEDLTKATMKKLSQGMSKQNKTGTDISVEENARIKTQKQNTTIGLRTCNNILLMKQSLHAKSPSFIGDKRINLSWSEAVKTVAPANTSGGKRPANALNGVSNQSNKRGRGGGNQLVDRPFKGLTYGRRGGSRGGGQGRGWGRRVRGRGRGYYL
ncbi:hypothetical protein R6Q57_028041 [Mikania cordata]